MCQIVELIEQTNATPSVRGYIPVSKRKEIARQISQIGQENSGIIISETNQLKILKIISEMYGRKIGTFNSINKIRTKKIKKRKRK